MARITIVDADAQLRAHFAATLGAGGHEVAQLARGRRALEEVLGRGPDLLLVGRRLDDGDGRELAARLRSCQARPFPIVLVSDDPADALRARLVGATEHLLTPVDALDLLGRVERLLAQDLLGEDLPRGPGGAVFDRYTLRALLGRGSFGDVYEARDVRTGELVALKVLARSDDDDDLTRFLREAQVLSCVQHEHVVAVRDAGLVGGRAFCAMRLVEGPTLDVHLRRSGPLGEREALQVLAGLLRALDALAREGFVHRDVTPRNVILEGGSPARPVLIDFGLAKAAQDPALTSTGVILGTPGYIAPELVQGAPADARSDVFSAGVAAVHAFLGVHPVRGKRGLALVRHMADAPIPVTAALSPDARALVARLTALDPADRPATPAEALALVEALLERPDIVDEPVTCAFGGGLGARGLDPSDETATFHLALARAS